MLLPSITRYFQVNQTSPGATRCASLIGKVCSDCIFLALLPQAAACTCCERFSPCSSSSSCFLFAFPSHPPPPIPRFLVPRRKCALFLSHSEKKIVLESKAGPKRHCSKLVATTKKNWAYFHPRNLTWIFFLCVYLHLKKNTNHRKEKGRAYKKSKIRRRRRRQTSKLLTGPLLPSSSLCGLPLPPPQKKRNILPSKYSSSLKQIWGGRKKNKFEKSRWWIEVEEESPDFSPSQEDAKWGGEREMKLGMRGGGRGGEGREEEGRRRGVCWKLETPPASRPSSTVESSFVDHQYSRLMLQ